MQYIVLSMDPDLSFLTCWGGGDEIEVGLVAPESGKQSLVGSSMIFNLPVHFTCELLCIISCLDWTKYLAIKIIFIHLVQKPDILHTVFSLIETPFQFRTGPI